MLRVLSISTLFPSPARPGFGTFVASQMRALSARGDVDLTMVHPLGLLPWPLSRLKRYRALADNPARFDFEGTQVFYPRYWNTPLFGWHVSPFIIADKVLNLAGTMHQAKPFDLIDAQFFYPDGPAARIVAQALGLPYSIKARGSDIHFWGKRPRALGMMLGAAEQSAGLLSVSEALKRDMIALGMPADRIAVHYTGLDHALFCPLPRAEARAAVADIAPVDGPLLATVGNLIPLKGQDLVIEALAELPGARLVIAGKGPEEQRLRELASRIRVSDRVVIAGSLPPEKLALLLSASDALVLPSEREGLANVWIESLACGTPLVITDVGGAREVVRDASAGRIVERSSAAIAAGVRDVLAGPPSQAEVAAHAAKFSWEENAAQLAAHYARVAGL